MFVRFSWMPQAAKYPWPSKFSTFNDLSKILKFAMSFNKGYELKKFEAHWEKLRIEYAAAGMMEDAIQKIYDYEAYPLPRPAPVCSMPMA